MAAPVMTAVLRNSRRILRHKWCIPVRNPVTFRLYSSKDDSSSPNDVESSTKIKKTGFADAFLKLERFHLDPNAASTPKNDETFASMLRRSPLIQIGNPERRVVIGIIKEVVHDDLYIDFGGKFHCVCKSPKENPEAFTRGVKVKILLHNLELSSKFLGSEQQVTLLEADATLLGLFDAPKQQKSDASHQTSKKS